MCPAALISKTKAALRGSSACPQPRQTNQKLIEAAGSSCCYSNRQHCFVLIEKHVFGTAAAVAPVDAQTTPTVYTICLNIFAGMAVY